jgi:hypothetical protein
VVIPLAVGDQPQIIQAARDPGLVAQGPESLQRLGEERGGPLKITLVAGQNPQPAQGAP